MKIFWTLPPPKDFLVVLWWNFFEPYSTKKISYDLLVLWWIRPPTKRFSCGLLVKCFKTLHHHKIFLWSFEGICPKLVPTTGFSWSLAVKTNLCSRRFSCSEIILWSTKLVQGMCLHQRSNLGRPLFLVFFFFISSTTIQTPRRNYRRETKKYEDSNTKIKFETPPPLWGRFLGFSRL